MTRSERAAQLWSLLAFCASTRHVLSYEIVSRLIGVPRQGLGQLLEPIQSYCILRELPPLTSLVVSEVSGLPGEGFIAAEDVPRAQAQVFEFDWLSHDAPTVDDLEVAANELPSSGRLLAELLREAEERR